MSTLEPEMRPVTAPEAIRQHAYLLLQRDAKLSLADCQFYEEEVRRWVKESRTFTAYEISREVNGRLIQAGRAWLRHTLTGSAVHLLVSLYAGPAGYRSDLVDLSGGRSPRLYYPDGAGRQQWETEHMPLSLEATANAAASAAPPGKPGRKRTTEDIADYANERRWQGMSWKDIDTSWKTDHPGDPRNKALNWRKFYDTWQRYYGNKRKEESR